MLIRITIERAGPDRKDTPALRARRLRDQAPCRGLVESEYFSSSAFPSSAARRRAA
ncbi:MAG: hypothetical protein V3S24_12570 [Candidatus Tectomicrobia bacterium]